MLELFQVPNFSLNWWFWYFGPNLLKKGISYLKQKNSTFVASLVDPPLHIHLYQKLDLALSSAVKSLSTSIALGLSDVTAQFIKLKEAFNKGNVQSYGAAEERIPGRHLSAQS